jgi:hypothetical protein
MSESSITPRGRFKLRTSALRAYTMLLALIVWIGVIVCGRTMAYQL